MKKILIVVPFFNQAHYLKETLESVLTQSSQAWDLIVLDDSIDDRESASAKQIIRSLNHPQIAYQKNEKNLGMALNWNQALDLGKNHLAVTLLHGDDRLLPEYVESMISGFMRHPDADALFCKTEIINSSGKHVFSLPDWYKSRLIPKLSEFKVEGELGIQSLIRGNYIFCPTLCYQSRLLGNERFDPNYKMVLDLDLIFRLLKKGAHFYGLYHKPLFQYRRHSSNATAAMTANLHRFEEEEKLLRPYLKNKRNNIIVLHLAYLFLYSLLKLQWKLAFKFFKKMRGIQSRS